MKIVYVGNRPVVSIMCSGRVNFVWHKDNDFTQEVSDPKHVAQILRSVQHKFESYAGDVPKKKKAPEPVLSHPAIAEPNEAMRPIEIPQPKKTKSVKQLNVKGKGNE